LQDAWVLISIVPTKEKEIYSKLIKTSGIIDIHPIFGDYDLIVKIQKESIEDVGAMVIEEIRSIDGIVNTKTLAGTTFS
jgi:DNA-binding Lrp family transcriptional regulator